MCPHCIFYGIIGIVLSLPLIGPIVAYLRLKGKAWKKKLDWLLCKKCTK